MRNAVEWFQIPLFVGLLLFSWTGKGETNCTGIAPPNQYQPTSATQFVSCQLVCGTVLGKDQQYGFNANVWLPDTWGWTTHASSPQHFWNSLPWDMIPKGGITSVNSGTAVNPTLPAVKNNLVNSGASYQIAFQYGEQYSSNLLVSNFQSDILQDPANPQPIAKQGLIGVSAFMGGDSWTDLYLKTNQRTFQVSGGELVKCANWADGANEPFIFVANKTVHLGWLGMTPVGGTVFNYDVGSYPLQPGEIPETFYMVSVENTLGTGEAGQWLKWINYFMYFRNVPRYIDSGLRTHANGTQYRIAAYNGAADAAPLRIQKNGNTLGLVLVDPTDPYASPFKMIINSQVKALRSCFKRSDGDLLKTDCD